MSENVLERLKQAEIEILDEIDRICKKHELDYFLTYGTLLGAVRHKGFIPWDDDIDIGMTRDDYNRFIEIAPKELNDKFILDNISTNNKYYLPFVKVRSNSVIYEEKNSINYNGPKGIWVDIFPYDNIKCEKKSKKLIYKCKVLNFLYACLAYKSLKLDSVSNKIKKISKFLSHNFIFKIINSLSINSNNSCKFVIYYQMSNGEKTPIIRKNDIFPTSKLKFGEKEYNVPLNYKAVLRKFYGNDYMKLPPLSERVTHNPIKIVLENGEEINFEKKESI